MKVLMNRLLLVMLLSVLLSACETAQVPDASVGNVPTTDGKVTSSQSAPKTTTETPPMNAAVSVPAAKPSEPAPPVVVKPLYEKGDYRGAIRKLSGARDAADESPVVKQNSLKYLAFSYCVTSQKPLCKTQFSSLLKLVPTFELSRGEAGHPLWGPVFKEAKAANLKEAKPVAVTKQSK
jgi:hypothetical protein